MVCGPDGKGRDCKSQARKYTVRFRGTPPYRCSSMVERRSPKPRVVGSIPTTGANLVTPHGADLGLISPKRWFESIWHHQKKDVDFCIGNAYIEVNRDEAIASISHAH